jgi:hypothetical protein
MAPTGQYWSERAARNIYTGSSLCESNGSKGDSSRGGNNNRVGSNIRGRVGSNIRGRGISNSSRGKGDNISLAALAGNSGSSCSGMGH